MNYKYVLPLVAVLALAASQRSEAATILFNNTTTFDATFPISTRYLTGGLSTAGLVTSPDQLKLFAQKSSGESGTFARSFIYSTTDTAYDFLASTKKFSFNSATLTMVGGGTAHLGILGVFSGNGGAVTAPGGPGDGVYFQINRATSQVFLQARQDTVTTTLATFTLTGYAFDDMSFTLNGTTWSASVTQGTTQTFNGTFATAYDMANWGTDYYIGLGASQGSSSDTRSTQLNLTSITVAAVPEPSAVVMASLGLGLLASVRFFKKR